MNVVCGSLYESLNMQSVFVRLGDCATSKLLHLKVKPIFIKGKPNRQTLWAGVIRTGR